MVQKEESSKKSIEDELNYWKEVGDNSFKEGNYLGALEAYETIARSDPENSEAWKGMATAFSLLDKPYEALESLDNAIEINPSDIESVEIKGLILKKLLEENQERLNQIKEQESLENHQKLV
jgi:tetratricopeptide (TPR) repeat protein